MSHYSIALPLLTSNSSTLSQISVRMSNFKGSASSSTPLRCNVNNGTTDSEVVCQTLPGSGQSYLFEYAKSGCVSYATWPVALISEKRSQLVPAKPLVLDDLFTSYSAQRDCRSGALAEVV